MGRTDDRAGFTDDVRIRLLERDADVADERIDRVVAEIAGVRKVLTGILVAIVTGCIMLTINVIVLRAGT